MAEIQIQNKHKLSFRLSFYLRVVSRRPSFSKIRETERLQRVMAARLQELLREKEDQLRQKEADYKLFCEVVAKETGNDNLVKCLGEFGLIKHGFQPTQQPNPQPQRLPPNQPDLVPKPEWNPVAYGPYNIAQANPNSPGQNPQQN